MTHRIGCECVGCAVKNDLGADDVRNADTVADLKSALKALEDEAAALRIHVVELENRIYSLGDQP
jgi:hypothetical protein